MIHIEVSVEPHYNTDGPPHVIIQREFNSFRDAEEFIDHLGLHIEGDQHKVVLDNPDNEYVQVELEIMDITGTVYTKAGLAIEGKENE